MPKAKQIAIPKMTDVSRAAKADAKDADKSLELVRKLSIGGSTDYEVATKWVAEVKDKRDALDAERKRFVEPLRGVIKDIDAVFRPVLQSLDEAEKIIKGKISGYVEACALSRDKLIESAGKASSPKKSEALIVEADRYVVPKVAGLTIKQGWDGEVVDASKLPREYLIPDLKALKARTKSVGGDPQIPGWHAFPKATVAIEVNKVSR